PEPVDRVDQRCRRSARRARETGAEERVDDDVGHAELLLLLLGLRLDDEHVPAALAEHARGDAPVAAVRAAAADDRYAPCAREAVPDDLGDGGARALHELRHRLRVARMALLGGAHFAR